MELTTSYQRLAEAYLGTDSYGANLYIRIYAKYSEQDVSNNRTKVQYQARAYFDRNWNIYDRQSHGTVAGTSANTVSFSKSDNYTGGETTLGTTEAWVTHNADGTMSINASAYLIMPNYGWSATATGTATLPNLHKPPLIETAEIVETNQEMINLGVANTTIVPYLSEKTITLHATPYDDATLSYKLEHAGTDYIIPASGFQVSNVFNTNYRQNEITYDSNNKARILQRIHDNLNGEASNWLFVSINGNIEQPDVIPYNKPIIERASTSIKRKSGVYSETLQRVANLTDNITSLNLKATIYKGNDAIGNNNSLATIGYKVWATDDTEPASYTAISPLPTPDSDGNITITDFEITNVLFTKVYNYKIIVTDGYSYSDEILDGRISIGQPLWTEYKDRVDFMKLTVNGYNPFEYSENEAIIGVWMNKPLYRKTIIDSSGISAGANTIAHNISNVDVIFINSGKTFMFNSTTGKSCPLPINQYNSAQSYDQLDIFVDRTNVTFLAQSGWSSWEAYITVEFTKTTD